MSDTQKETILPIREAREMVKDLMSPNAFIYWADFLFHVTLGWSTFFLCLKLEFFSLSQLVCFFISTFSLFRSAIFIHELTHLRKGTFVVFRTAWNFLCGFPLMIPSFLYQGVHNDHHNVNLYGTEGDGEYFPFVTEGRLKIVVFVLISFFLPVFLFIRFVFLTPISYCHKSLRSMVLGKVSSLSIDLNYKRTRSSLNTVPMWKAQEAITCLYGWTFLFLIIQGVFPYSVFSLWFLIFGAVFFVNSLRTLVAHCYRHSGNKNLNLSEQLIDSINIPESLFGILWAPVGLRFHATHHLIPEIPYHSLGKTHRRLLEKFSEKNLYIQTSSRSLCSALKRLWKESGNLS